MYLTFGCQIRQLFNSIQTFHTFQYPSSILVPLPPKKCCGALCRIGKSIGPEGSQGVGQGSLIFEKIKKTPKGGFK